MNEFARPLNIGENGKVNYGTDDGLLVEFHIKPILMEQASKDQGHPIYEDRIFTRIISPGNTKTTWDYQSKGLVYNYDHNGELESYSVDESEIQCDPLKYPKAWERFTKRGQKVKEGMDIREWGAIPRSFAETLKGQNIHTVEALAALTDQNCANIMGGLKFRDMARAWKNDTETMALASREQERANKAEEMVKDLRKQMKAMQDQINALNKKSAA
jgi:hypothetical protein